jgi:hypothetical protein
MRHRRIQQWHVSAEGQPDHTFDQLLDREQERDRSEGQFAPPIRNHRRPQG